MRGGRGVQASGSHARSWLKKTAEQNDEKAVARLGIRYYKGEGGKKDYREAARLFNSINESSALAQYYSGGMYAHGMGVDKNYETAIAWYSKAADGGFDMARGNIINLEEEIKMNERRRMNMAKKQGAPEKTPKKKSAVKKQVKAQKK